MPQYLIKYSPARDTFDQFASIQRALEDYSDTLGQMSRQGQKGLENEAQMMGIWSTIASEHADSVNQASKTLQEAVDSYENAERLSYERLTESGLPGVGSMSLSNMLRIIKMYNAYRKFLFWSNILKARPNWGKLNVLIHWTKLWPVNLYFLTMGRRELISISKLISRLINQRNGAQKGSGAVPGEIGGGSENGVSSGVKTGGGVTALPEEKFADAEADVKAKEGSAEGAADEWIDEGAVKNGDEAPIEEANEQTGEAVSEETGADAGAEAGEQTSEQAGEAVSEETGADAGAEAGEQTSEQAGEAASISEEFSAKSSGGRGGGGGGGGGKTQSAQGIPETEDIPAFTEPIPEVEQPTAPEEPVIEQPDTSSNYAYQGSNVSAYEVKPAAPAIPSALKAPSKTGAGISTPVIGLTAAASVAASGLGMSNKLGGKKNAGNDGITQQAEVPVVTAKEAPGNFSGNLKGEYALLGAAMSIMFSGASLMAGVGSKKNKSKPDDRYKIGYGTSAILSGGAIQERS